MSPALLKKYLAAARRVADHLVLKPAGFDFAPSRRSPKPTATSTASGGSSSSTSGTRSITPSTSWRPGDFKNRSCTRQAKRALREFAADAGLSARVSRDGIEGAGGKLAARRDRWAELQALWRKLPADVQTARPKRKCEVASRCATWSIRLRKGSSPRFGDMRAKGISPGSQPFVLWRARRLAAGRMSAPAESAQRDVKEFCRVFPDAFVVSDRPPYFDLKGGAQGRPLSAGFHLMQGYFRDDAPLCELVLDDAGRRELDRLWRELNFVTGAPMRQYRDFIFFERAEPPRYMRESAFDFARSEDKDSIRPAKIEQLRDAYLAKARKNGVKAEALKAIETYFAEISSQIRQVEKDRLAAEPSHLEALSELRRSRLSPAALRGRAKRSDRFLPIAAHPGTGSLTKTRSGIRSRACSSRPTLPIASIWPSRAPPRGRSQAMSWPAGLSYFLWSSMPDDELLSHAASGDLVETLRPARANPAHASRRAGSPVRHRVRRELAGIPPLRGTQRRRSRAISKLHKSKTNRTSKYT